MMEKRLGLFNLLAFSGMIAVNVLADALPLFGLTTAQVSRLYPTLIAPAPYAFAIWGLIYALLLGFCVFGLTPAGRASGQVGRAGGLFAATCLLNALWLIAWHALLIVWSLAILAVLLVSLSAIYLRLRDGAPAVNRPERIWVRLPFSVYLGWVSVAVIANAAAALVSLGWDSGAAVFWTCLMAAVAAALGGVMLVRRRDWAYAAVIVWALVAIGVKNIGSTPIFLTSILGASAILAGIVTLLTGPRRQSA